MLIGYKESKNISYTLKKNKKIIIFNKIKKLIKYLKNNINKLSYVNFKKKYK
ncbi:MAG: hypothetical protein ABNO52_00410 [Candidatus Shikimatogenerans sp. Tser]|uniref:Uncharacterized protein n=1 Tax=Candidatus Shikimatogenerans sp. Tser TaxID=3158568 RepID=A0AAU7QT34_9FLAO